MSLTPEASHNPKAIAIAAAIESVAATDAQSQVRAPQLMWSTPRSPLPRSRWTHGFVVPAARRDGPPVIITPYLCRILQDAGEYA